MRRHWLTSLLVVMLALVSAVAGAEPSKADKKRAKSIFEAGVALYNKGQFQAALTKFQAAQDLAYSPTLYFNIANCEERLGHFSAAALMLKTYLLEKADDPDKKQIEERIATLEEMASVQKQAAEPSKPAVEKPPPEAVIAPVPAPVPVPPPAPAPPERPKRLYTWIAAGVTGALALTAVGVGTVALLDHNDLAGSCSAVGAPGCAQSQVDGVTSKALATDIVIGVAAAAAITTVVLYVIEPRLGKSSTSAWLTPAGVRF